MDVHSGASASAFELHEQGNLPNNCLSHKARRKYVDGTTIDWLYEESSEREQRHLRRSQRGVRGLLAPHIDSCRMWAVVILTGIGIGLTGVSRRWNMRAVLI
jgi:chloride channel 3/4/5